LRPHHGIKIDKRWSKDEEQNGENPSSSESSPASPVLQKINIDASPDAY
jgi:hypothetical protein